MRSGKAGDRPPHHQGLRRLAAALAVTAAAALAAAGPALPAHAAPFAVSAAGSRAGSSGGEVTQGQAIAQAEKTGKSVQVTGATTSSSTLAANPDGSLTLDEDDMPVRKDVGGTWENLDATLQQDSGGTVSPAVTANAVTLSGGGTTPLVTMTSQGQTLSLSVAQALPKPVLSGDTATYQDVPVAGADLEVTVDTQGDFEDTIVVNNATAAKSPALRSFTLRPKASSALTLKAGQDGSLTADNRGGTPFFEIPAATMWDSRPVTGTVRTGTDPAYGGRKVDLRDGQPVTSAASSPGEDARTATIPVKYSGGVLTYTPDQSVLTSKNTVYPVYLDPAAGSTRTFWAQADSTWPTQTYPKPNPMQVGHNGWESPYFTARSYVNESVPSTIDGGDIESATLYLTDEYAPACGTSDGDFGVQVWRTGSVGTGTDWDNQPTWAAEEQEKAFSAGYDSSCPAASEGFNVKEAMTQAAGNSWPQVTFGIKADNESDPYGWKQFSDTVSLSTTYDKAPDAPGDLRTSPVTSCTAATPTTVGLGDVTLYSTLGDPLGSAAGSLTASVTVTDTTTDTAVKGSPFKLTGLGAGSIATVLLPEDTLQAMADGAVNEFSWSATATDGTLTSPASKTCHFNFDPTTPGAPTVTAEDTSYTIGTAATFDITPNDSGGTPTSYDYQVNGAAVHTVAADSTGDATISVTPASGTNALTVTSISAGGNIGDSFNLPFNAAAAANAADGDLSGDGIPDLLTPGGGASGLAPGLWLANGQAGPGTTSGDGQIVSSIADIGSEGDGITGDYSPSDFNGAQVVTGRFNDNGFQDTLVYYPAGTYAGNAVILGGNGNGTVLIDQDSSNTTGLDPSTFTGSDPNGDIPLQVANGYDADPNDTGPYPDLITVSGDATNGYYLEYYQEGGNTGYWWNSFALTTATPDGTMDWNDWQITTMAEPSGAVDMFLYNASTGALDLWQGLTVDDTADTASYTQYQLSSDWNPGTVSELRAADIAGTGPALWAVTDTGTATAWTTSGLTTGGAPAITAQPAQSLLSPTHEWDLNDGTDGEASTAADTGSGTPIPLTGTATGATWTTGDLFSPAANFDGSTGGMTGTSTTTPAINPTANYTVSAWVKPSTAGGAVLALSDETTGESCLALYIESATSPSGTTYKTWNVRTTSADSASFTATDATPGPTYPVRVGSWTHLTLTYNAAGKYLTLYVNGVPAGTSQPGTTWTSGCDSLELGHYYTGGEEHARFNGDLADVQAWNGTTLTPAEAADLSGTPGYILFPSDGTQYASVAASSDWPWNADCGRLEFYEAQIYIQERTNQTGATCSAASGTVYKFGPGGTASSVLTLQIDGNLVIYPSAADASAQTGALWATGTSGNPGDVMFFQPDGNLVIYNTYGGTLWASGTQN